MIDAVAILLGVILTFLMVVVIHELGHFFAARLVGVKAAVFSIGFGKPIWSRTDRRGVLWQVTRIPAGGYVKFVGDENAASLSSVPDGPIVPGSLRAVSKSAQAFVALAGPVANLMFTFALLCFLPLLSGVTSYPWIIDDVADYGSATALQSGDKVLSIEDTTIRPQDTVASILMRLPDQSAVDYQIERDGTHRAVTAPRPDLPLIGFVADGSPADVAGLIAGDLLMAVDGDPLHGWSDLQAAVSRSGGAALDVVFLRDLQEMAATINPKLQSGHWRIGVSAVPLITVETERPSVVAAIGIGFDQTWSLIAKTVTGISGAAIGLNDSCDLDGPIAIASVAGEALQLGAEPFLLFLAVISLGLGILNLLPVPILDGGHLVLLGYEGLTGRPLGKRMQAVLFIAGVTVIVFLMLTATINDLTC